MDKATRITSGPDGMFEVHAPDVDMEALVQRLEASLAAHQPLFANAPGMPSFTQREHGSAADTSELLYHLRCAEDSQSLVGAEKELAPSWAAQLPLVGRWWGRIRGEAHNLILFYVNRAAGRQASFNEHTAGVLRYVAKQAEEIDRLEARIARLEAQLQSPEGSE